MLRKPDVRGKAKIKKFIQKRGNKEVGRCHSNNGCSEEDDNKLLIMSTEDVTESKWKQ